VARPITVLAASAAATAAAALGHTALAFSTVDAAVPVHERSAFYVLATAAVTLLWAGAIVFTRSTSIAAAGGVLTGGVAANLAALAIWDGVPNPLLAGDLAFNVADVAVAIGLLLVLATTVGFAARNRARLHERVRI
jgi:hypothetical protein